LLLLRESSASRDAEAAANSQSRFSSKRCSGSCCSTISRARQHYNLISALHKSVRNSIPMRRTSTGWCACSHRAKTLCMWRAGSYGWLARISVSRKPGALAVNHAAMNAVTSWVRRRPSGAAAGGCLPWRWLEVERALRWLWNGQEELQKTAVRADSVHLRML